MKYCIRKYLKLFFNLDEFHDAIVHFFNGIVFGKTHATLVGNIVDATLSLGVFAASSAHLQVVLRGYLLELSFVGGQLRHLDVHGGANSRSQIRWTKSEESKTVIVGEWYSLLDVVDGSHQTTVYLTQITTHLHGDDTKMILLIAPDQEGLGVVVVDATSARPVAASISRLQETITFLEQEMVVDEFLLYVLGHSGQWIEGTLEFSLKAGQGGRNLMFHLLVLLFREARVEGVTLHGATAADPGGYDELTSWVKISHGVAVSPVLGWMFVSLFETVVVVLNDWVEDVGEQSVSLGIGSVDTNTGVVVFQT